MNITSLRCLVLLALLLPVSALHAQTLRCGSRIVGTGDYDVQVRDRCGDPFWIENRYEVVVTGADSALETQTGNTYTAW